MIIGASLVFLFFLIYLLEGMWKIPPNLSFATKVTIFVKEPNTGKKGEDAFRSYEITDKADIDYLRTLVTEDTVIDSGDCGFGSCTILFGGPSRRILIVPADDSCTTVYVVFNPTEEQFYTPPGGSIDTMFCMSAENRALLWEYIIGIFPDAYDPRY